MRRWVWGTTVYAIGFLSITSCARTQSDGTTDSAASAAGSVTTVFREYDDRTTAIRVWHTALDADSTSAYALGQLAALYAQRSREGGGEADVRMAEAMARRSLDERTSRNSSTAATLATVLLSQHRFREAFDIARELVAYEPEVAQYRALLAEIAMELGEYKTARAMFESVWTDRARLSTAARLARWYELNGYSRTGRQLLKEALDRAMQQRELASETKAWFHLRLADMEERAGHPRAARELLRTALTIEPDDPRVQASLARLAFHERDWTNAIAWGERSIARTLDPALLGTIADAHAALGDSAMNVEFTDAAGTMLAAQSMQHRAGELFLLDRGIDVANIYTRAQCDIADRADVYGYDLLAWAAFKNQELPQAIQAMQQALRLRTYDPLLHAHAEAIAEAAGARDIPVHFDLTLRPSQR